jgi:hypothetical protein
MKICIEGRTCFVDVNQLTLLYSYDILTVNNGLVESLLRQKIRFSCLVFCCRECCVYLQRKNLVLEKQLLLEVSVHWIQSSEMGM